MPVVEHDDYPRLLSTLGLHLCPIMERIFFVSECHSDSGRGFVTVPCLVRAVNDAVNKNLVGEWITVTVTVVVS